ELDINNTLWGQQINRASEFAQARKAQADMLEHQLAVILETNEAILEITGNASLLGRVSLTEFANDAVNAAQGLTNAATALENVFRVVVGNTNAIGNQV